MPETAIDKYGQPESGKNEIRSDGLTPPSCVRPRCDYKRDWLVSSPTRNFLLPKQTHEGDFGALIATPLDVRHHFRSFRRGEYVSHGREIRFRTGLPLLRAPAQSQDGQMYPS